MNKNLIVGLAFTSLFIGASMAAEAQRLETPGDRQCAADHAPIHLNPAPLAHQPSKGAGPGNG